MATFEIEASGKKYQIEAPDQQSAIEAIQSMQGQGGQATPAGSGPAYSAPQPTGEMRAYEPGFLESIGNFLFDSAKSAGLPASRMRRDAQGLDAAVRGAADSATFGLADEISAGMGSLTGIGGKEGDYSGNLSIQRSIDQMDAEINPVARGIGQVGGAVMTLPITGTINAVRAPAAASRIAKFGADVVNSGLTGAAYGGAYGFGSGEGGAANRAISAGEGAMTGGAVGFATPPMIGAGKWIAQQAFGRPIAAMANAVAPKQRAANALKRAIIDDAASAGMSPQQAIGNMETAQRAGVPLKPLDMGESTRQLGRTAANLSPQGRDILKQSVDQRFTSQANRLIDTITRVAPGVNSPQTSRFLQDAASRANRANYSRAYRDGSGGIWHEGFQQLTVSPDMQAAIRDATRIGANEAAIRGARPPKNPFRMNADGTIDPIPNVQPTLEFWDHVKRSLDGQIGIQQRAGNKEYASQLTQLKGQLVGYLDRAVPSYAQARSTAASFFGADDALEAGRLFVRRAGDNAGVREAIEKMTPAERQLFGEGFATQMIEDLRNIPDRLTVINKVFQSPAARERFELALGPKAVDAMEATMRLEAIMDLGRLAVTGNSTTAQQLIAQGLLGTGAGAAVTGGDFTNPTTYITAALTVGLARAGRAGMDRASQKMARELADMLASNDPKVVREAVGRIGSQPQVLNALRSGHTWITRALQPLVAEGGGTAPAMVDSGTGSQPAQAGN